MDVQCRVFTRHKTGTQRKKQAPLPLIGEHALDLCLLDTLPETAVEGLILAALPAPMPLFLLLLAFSPQLPCCPKVLADHRSREEKALGYPRGAFLCTRIMLMTFRHPPGKKKLGLASRFSTCRAPRLRAS